MAFPRLPSAQAHYVEASGKPSREFYTWLAQLRKGLDGVLLAENDLSDVDSVTTALSNLGGLAKASNLSDLANIGTARANLAFFDTRATAIAATISSSVNVLYLAGYAAAGDGGFAIYKRLGSTPSPSKPWHLHSADGAWWILAPSEAVYAKQLGVTADGSTNDTTAMQAAIDFTELTGGVLLLPAGNIMSSTLSITSQISIRGVGVGLIGIGVGGSNGTNIWATSDLDVFSIVTWDAVSITDLTIRSVNPAGATKAGVRAVPPDLTVSSGMRGLTVRNVNFIGGAYTVFGDTISNFRFEDNFTINQRYSGLFIGSTNSVNRDSAGDCMISNNVFVDLDAAATGAGIEFSPTSGMVVVGNKMLGWQNGISLNVTGASGTLLIADNSIEEFAVNGIRVTHDGNAAHLYGYLDIHDNQIQVSGGSRVTYQGGIAVIIGTAGYIKQINIHDNIIALFGGGSGAFGIDVEDGSMVNVHDNNIDMGNTATAFGIVVSGNASNVQVANNMIRNYTTRFSLATGTRVLDAISYALWTTI